VSRASAAPGNVDALQLYRMMGRERWSLPAPFGPDGWSMVSRDRRQSIIVSCAEHDGAEWVHASIAHTTYLPTYADLTRLRAAVWGDTGWAYQVFAPPSAHVNIHERALHLYGRLDGQPVLPEFSGFVPGVGRSI
jgi:hypothetical protein